ncbi:MAG: hypothetical protein NTZ97_02065 [Candidatus Moranbacteria bacterium]|nr:hypothetical protein [Candidatus Moranbacteria bacterium]
MWNPFKKNNKQDDKDGEPKMGFLQSMALKRFEKMSPEKREKVMQDAFDPKNRKKLLKSFDEMERSGMASKSQIRKAKERLGIYE